MTAQDDHPSELWAGNPRLVEVAETSSLEQLGESLRRLAAHVTDARTLDGGKLWTDPPAQAELGAVFDEVTRRLVGGALSPVTILLEFFDVEICDAYIACVTALLDGRSPAERAADIVKAGFAERAALIPWEQSESASADASFDELLAAAEQELEIDTIPDPGKSCGARAPGPSRGRGRPRSSGPKRRRT